MSRKLIIALTCLAAAGGAGFVYRDQVLPWINAHLPPAFAAMIKDRQPTGGEVARAPDEGRAVKGKGEAKGKEVAQATGKGGRGGGGGAAPVTAAVAAVSDMPIVLSAPGTVEPLATVGVKPRVDGQIVKVGFIEGDMVQDGQVLFILDDRLVRAQIRQAEANIAKDVAALKDAELIRDRKDLLFQKRYTSEASADTARQQVESLKASIAAGQALLEAQRTQLDYLTIRAPITGRTGNVTAKLGANVRTNDPIVLVTINQTKPIAVVVRAAANRPALLEARAGRQIAGGNHHSRRESRSSCRALLSFVDNQVDKLTGTVTAKVIAANEDERCGRAWPSGSSSRRGRRNRMAVPASAVLPPNRA